MSSAEVERLARLAQFRETHRSKLRASSTDDEVRASVKHTAASLAATGGNIDTFLCLTCLRTTENSECICPSCMRETARVSALEADKLDTQCAEDDEPALDTTPGSRSSPASNRTSSRSMRAARGCLTASTRP